VGALDAAEVQQLAAEVRAALAAVGPTYAGSDWEAWQEVLVVGARHASMQSTAISLAGCAEYGHGAIVWRPEWFWGVPRGKLLDGHWMAFRAARKAWVDEDGGKSIAETLRQAQMRRG
jgi:hypothetical protein